MIYDFYRILITFINQKNYIISSVCHIHLIVDHSPKKLFLAYLRCDLNSFEWFSQHQNGFAALLYCNMILDLNQISFDKCNKSTRVMGAEKCQKKILTSDPDWIQKNLAKENFCYSRVHLHWFGDLCDLLWIKRDCITYQFYAKKLSFQACLFIHVLVLTINV